MRKLVLLSLILCFVVAFPVLGEAGKRKAKTVLDMGKYTCGELLAEDEEGMGLILFWIDGYYGGKYGSTKVDFDALSGMAEELGAACAKNKKAGVLDTVKKITGGK